MKTQEFTKFANSFQAIARLGLESIERLLFYLDNPEKHLKFIHIAGTNGKGSVSAFLQCILTDAGYRTGKYISPNMISVCERVSVDGENISQIDLDIILERVRKASQQVEAQTGCYPTQFEIWTAAAFLYFLEKKCDIVVLETGLGGRCDATNIIPAPEISIITHIALDHMQYLGNTIADIAREKGGIIKKPLTGEGFTITARQDPNALKALSLICKERNHRLIEVENPVSLGWDKTGEYFNYKSIENLHTSMLGTHQPENAALAIEAALHMNIPICHIKSGVERAKNIGRFEIISNNPLIVFDGAHNPDGMRSLVSGLNRYFPDKTKDFIMACMADKDITATIAELKQIENQKDFYTLAVKDNPRSETADGLSEKLSEFGIFSKPCTDISEAIKSSKADMIVICGSLYLYKDLYDAGFIPKDIL